MKKQNKIKTKIEFGGFYESIHSHWIDRNIESDYDNGMGIQEQNQMMNEPMMAKGGLMSASHYKK